VSAELSRVTELSLLMAMQKSKVEALEEDLARAKEAFRRTAEEDLPELMREIGLASIKLEDGSSVEVRDEVDAALTADKKAAALDWLQANGFGGIIKTTVSVAFDKSEREHALETRNRLHEQGLQAELNEGVHPSTLKSFVKEQLAAGTAVPFDLFSIRPYSKAKLTPPRRK
jgi:hypothetical protein